MIKIKREGGDDGEGGHWRKKQKTGSEEFDNAGERLKKVFQPWNLADLLVVKCDRGTDFESKRWVLLESLENVTAALFTMYGKTWRDVSEFIRWFKLHASARLKYKTTMKFLPSPAEIRKYHKKKTQTTPIISYYPTIFFSLLYFFDESI